MTAISPFTILIDPAEQHPWPFTAIKDGAGQSLTVNTAFASLGRHPNSYGDYSIYGHDRRVAIERKSVADAQSTILGFKDGHRARFEQELANLATIPSLVIVEGSFEFLLESARETPFRTAAMNRRTIYRSLLSFWMDYKVPWFFAGSREVAEVTAYRFFERYLRKFDESQRSKASNPQGEEAHVRDRSAGGSVGGGGDANGAGIESDDRSRDETEATPEAQAGAGGRSGTVYPAVPASGSGDGDDDGGFGELRDLPF